MILLLQYSVGGRVKLKDYRILYNKYQAIRQQDSFSGNIRLGLAGAKTRDKGGAVAETKQFWLRNTAKNVSLKFFLTLLIAAGKYKQKVDSKKDKYSFYFFLKAIGTSLYLFRSVAESELEPEPVEPKLFEIYSRSRN